jgi:hypothetical protein
MSNSPVFSPRSILELGIFQGGSYVLLDKLFRPRRMSAVEINQHPVAPLLRYVAATEAVSCTFLRRKAIVKD